MEGVDKIFWPVLVVLFFAVSFFVGYTIYESYRDVQIKKMLIGDESEMVKITDGVFVCENDNSVESRAYVYLHGFRDHNPKDFDYQRSLILKDIKTKSILDYDYDETLTLDEISDEFIVLFNDFIARADVEEVVIIGKSAGGVIAAYSAHRIRFGGPVEIHTLASPLKGYTVSERYVGGRIGFEKEMAMGLNVFKIPASNVKVFHHKTKDDRSLASWCEEYIDYCDPLRIQNNNMAGSKEFYYSGEDHNSIVKEVSKMIIECHN